MLAHHAADARGPQELRVGPLERLDEQLLRDARLEPKNFLYESNVLVSEHCLASLVEKF